MNKSYARSVIVILILLLSSLWQCKGSKKKEQHREKVKPVKKVKVPSFNADSAYYFIEKQVSFGPRVPNSPAHRKAAKYLTGKLSRYSPNVDVQTGEVKAYNGNVLALKNIQVSFYPQKKRKILLAAHWDTRHIADHDTIRKDKPIPGANDGGSGTAVLLELSRIFSKHEPPVGIEIVLFDAEDYGAPRNFKTPQGQNSYCLGSQYWGNHLKQRRYRNVAYGILLDMVGAKNAVFNLEGYSVKYAPGTVDKIWNTAHELTYSNYFTFEKIQPLVDDHIYISGLAGIPCINIIDYDPSRPKGFGNYWHTHRDNMTIISKKTLKAAGQTVLTVIFQEDTPL